MSDDANGASRTEFVYLIGSETGPLVKIGRTNNVQIRLAAIQRMSPAKLVVLWQTEGGFELETALHRRFKTQRSHGEWFEFPNRDAPDQVVRAIADISAMERWQRAKLRAAKRACKVRAVWTAPKGRRLRKVRPSSRVAEERRREDEAFDQRIKREIDWIKEKPVERVKRATELLAELNEFSAECTRIRRESVANLLASGVTQAEVADAIGVTRGRVAQIAKEAQEKPT